MIEPAHKRQELAEAAADRALEIIATALAVSYQDAWKTTPAGRDNAIESAGAERLDIIDRVIQRLAAARAASQLNGGQSVTLTLLLGEAVSPDHIARRVGEACAKYGTLRPGEGIQVPSDPGMTLIVSEDDNVHAGPTGWGTWSARCPRCGSECGDSDDPIGTCTGGDGGCIGASYSTDGTGWHNPGYLARNPGLERQLRDDAGRIEHHPELWDTLTDADRRIVADRAAAWGLA